MRAEPIPSFFLYGEPPRSVGDRFLHLEALDDRSRPSHWNIRPHAHANLNHLLFIGQGAGRMSAETKTISFTAPCLLLAPATVVHGFVFEADTAGSVLTISESYLREIVRREPAFGSLFLAAGEVALANPGVFVQGLDRLARELSWRAPGHAAAVEALLVELLVETLRSSAAAARRRLPPGPATALVARFRELVEQRYWTNAPVADYAASLAVTPKQLRLAAAKVAAASPLAIVHDRRLLEAKRMMLYSNMTMAEIGYHLGFEDPAYFSRFFKQMTGVSARRFRAGGFERETMPSSANE